MKRLASIITIITLALSVSAQRPTVSDDYRFVNYLIGSSFKDEAAVLLRQRTADGDTISFMKGYTFYSLHQLDSAVSYLATVAPSSPFFNEARLYGTLSEAHQGHYTKAEALLSSLATTADSSLRGLVAFEQAGLALLQRDLVTYDTILTTINVDDYRFSQELSALNQLRSTLPLQRRSPIVAGCLSAVVPGLGKVYGGNLGEGIAALLTVGSFGAITAENIVREGWGNWKSILFGSITAVFYVGNIYGSAVSVRVAANNQEQQNDVQILYNIHIPIRNSFRH